MLLLISIWRAHGLVGYVSAPGLCSAYVTGSSPALPGPFYQYHLPPSVSVDSLNLYLLVRQPRQYQVETDRTVTPPPP